MSLLHLEDSGVHILNQIAASLKKEKSWVAMNVSQGTADMSFLSAEVVDETTDMWWHSDDLPAWPIAIPFGHSVGCSYLCQNTGQIAVKVFVYLSLIDPQGITRATTKNPRYSTPQVVDPGMQYYTEPISGVIVDMNGLWVVYGRLEYDIA